MPHITPFFPWPCPLLKDDHTLITGICEYVIYMDEKDFVDLIKPKSLISCNYPDYGEQGGRRSYVLIYTILLRKFLSDYTPKYPNVARGKCCLYPSSLY